ncbi:MAG: tRNA (guanosine(37)-N1)-methyltransferase TrmD [Clostridiales bacterium]|nr:tRNA (guanosine(37)-N1)-methyltransferase TrmD [Clostridiales bacterium]
MNFYVMTLFPEMIEQGMNTSITGRAIAKGLLSLETVNIRDYSVAGNGRIDDYPYGGGAGMVMQAEPIYRAYEEVKSRITVDTGHLRVIYLTPQGRVFHQEMAQELAQEENLVFLCGHYEGVDERVIETVVTDQVSIGDYVLTGGELPAMVMMDAISRMVPGVLSNAESGQSESFSDHLLEYPQYSRPEIWRGQPVPPVLLSGHHGNVERWRREQSLIRTLKSRPELLKDADLDSGDIAFLKSISSE